MKNRQNKYKQVYLPAWIEVDLSAIRHNLSCVKRLIAKETAVLAPVKANGYGHGILQVSKALVESGIDYLGVSTVDEAILLRENGFKKEPILMLGAILPQAADIIVRYNITQAVGDACLARALDIAAKKQGTRAKVHIKVDTGMGRIGIWHQVAEKAIIKICNMKNLDVEGLFSHCSSAGEDHTATHKQINAFLSLVESVEKKGIYLKYKHIANSMAVVDYKYSHMNLIRPGIMLYGLCPYPVSFGRRVRLKPAMSLMSRVVFLKKVPAGRNISYGSTYTTTKQSVIATVPIGYGDGLSRKLSNRGYFIIKGRKTPIAGRVCMDQTMVDAGNISDIKVGDKVVLIGSQGKVHITANDIARICHTIPYEVICGFDKRIPKVYKNT